MDERWYVEAQSDFLAAGYELIMLCMAMDTVRRDSMAAVADAERELIAIKVPRNFRPLLLDLDSGDEEFFMDGDDREKDLSSPDSNDSGIQVDSVQNFHHLSNDLDDLYGVVKKPKRKPDLYALDGRCSSNSMTQMTIATPRTVEDKRETFPVAKQRKSLDNDPYATVEVDSDDEIDDAAYAVVKKKGMRIVKTNCQNSSDCQVAKQGKSVDDDPYATVEVDSEDEIDDVTYAVVEKKGMRMVKKNGQNLSNCQVAKQRKSLDDPYATVEVDSADDDVDDPTYAVVGKGGKGMRLLAESDDSNSCDDNGNLHLNNYNDRSDDNDDCTITESLLPEGWQKHEDECGSYYWHIKSGITQREPPLISSPIPAVRKSRTEIRQLATNSKSSTKSTDKLKHPVDADVDVGTRKQNHFTSGSSTSSGNRFLIHCQGSVPLAEEDLAEDRSGQTINQCISSLAHRPSILQPGKLQGLDLYLEFVGDQLVLTDVCSGSTVRSESVKSIRVWGVGREKDSRDFAYISFDPVMERHICWVFSCEKTGHEVANALRSTCYKILKDNAAFAARMVPALTSQNSGANRLVIESQVSREPHRGHLKNGSEGAVFPAPRNEAKKIINCHYLGMMKVPKPTGMDVLNDAMEMIYAGVPNSKWVSVSVEVAPSAVTVHDRGNTNSVIFDCRIRFLTFLGICINNCKLGAFIMHSAQNEFFVHVFHCIPDAGLFCRTIKAACKLRYQKCLDAQAQQQQEDRGKISHQILTRNPMPFQGLRESFQKKVIGMSNLFGGNSKKQQQNG